jgi:hypothetical protein
MEGGGAGLRSSLRAIPSSMRLSEQVCAYFESQGKIWAKRQQQLERIVKNTLLAFVKNTDYIAGDPLPNLLKSFS